MKYLFKILVFIACLLVGQSSYCDKSKVSQTDKQLIEQFWTDFKKAVNTKDKQLLSSLIKFPFNCDYCILDTSKHDESYYLKVTKQLFDKDQYKIFFDQKLTTTINKYSILFDILSITTDDTGKKCSLNFNYATVEPSKQWEGQQHFFTIEKINDKFLITSAWTVP